MISLAKKDFVETSMMNANDYLQSIAIAQSTPGPIAGSLATLIGYKLYGIEGMLIANIGIVLPSLFIIILIINFLNKHKESASFEIVLRVLRPITIAIILSILIFFINSTVLNGAKILTINDIFKNFNFGALFILLLSIFLTIRYKVNPMYIVIISGVLGAIIL